MFQTLIATILAYYQAHPDEAAIREISGDYATFARSVRFFSWAKRVAFRERPSDFQALNAQIALLEHSTTTARAQFEADMTAAFPLLF